MDISTIFLKILEFGSMGVLALALFFVTQMVKSNNAIQQQILGGQEASHSRLMTIMDKELAAERLERCKLEARIEEQKVEVVNQRQEIDRQKIEFVKQKQEIDMLKSEIEDKELKIARLVIQLREQSELNAKLRLELDQVCTERDELKRRVELLEKRQRDDDTRERKARSARRVQQKKDSSA